MNPSAYLDRIAWRVLNQESDVAVIEGSFELLERCQKELEHGETQAA
jgi:hypothetical protein